MELHTIFILKKKILNSFRYLQLICSKTTEEIKDEFYDELEKAYDKLKRNTIRVVLIYENAKIGREHMQKHIIMEEE